MAGKPGDLMKRERSGPGFVYLVSETVGGAREHYLQSGRHAAGNREDGESVR